MDTKTIIDILTRITNQQSEHYLAAKAKMQDKSVELGELIFREALSEPLKNLLDQQDGFKDGSGYMIWQGDNIGTGFHTSEIAKALVRRVESGQSPEQAVQWLEHVLATQEADGFLVMTLWGIEVPNSIQFSSDISLVSFTDSPPSWAKNWIIQATNKWDDNPLVPMLSRITPPTVLVKKVRISPLLTPANTKKTHRKPTKPSPSEQLESVRLALTCMGPCAPTQAAMWFHFEDTDIQAAVFHSAVTTHPLEIIPQFHEPSIRIIDPETASIINSLLELPDNVKKRVNIALDRLNRSIRRHNIGDKSLDLAIAIETLLAENSGENTYKVGLRAGLLDQGTQDSRMHTRATISALYSIRSAVVHNGEAPKDVSVKGSGSKPSSEVVTEAITITANIIKTIARHGSIPDWYRLELGSS